MSFLGDVILISNLVCSSVLFFTGVIVFYKYTKTNFTIMIYLGLATIFASLANLLQIDTLLGNPSPEFSNISVQISVFLFAGSFALLILFFDYFSGERQVFWLVFAVAGTAACFYLILASFITGASSIVYFIVDFDGFVLYSWSDTVTLVILPMMVAFAYSSYKILRRSEENAINDSQLRQIRLMKIGFFLLAVVSAVFGMIGSSLLLTFNNPTAFALIIFVVQRIFLVAGLLYIVYGYISVQQVAFLQPQRIETLLVIDQSGIPLYRYDFVDSEKASNTGLASGAITAIGALMQEAFGVTTNVRSIRFMDKELDLQFIENTAFILITSTSTKFTSDSLKRFALSFNDAYPKELDNPGMHIDDFAKSEPLVLTAFGLE